MPSDDEPNRPATTDGSAVLALSGELALAMAPLAKANAEFRAGAKSAATQKAYASDWRAFVAWCAGFRIPPLPAPPEAVAAYLTRLAVGERDATGELALDDRGEPKDPPRKAATIGRAQAAIASFTRHAGFPWDPKNRYIAETMEGIRNKLGTAPEQKSPVTKEILHSLVATLATTRTGHGALRDRALLCVGFIGGFRESELVALSREDLERRREGYKIRIRKSKTNQQGRLEHKVAPYGGGADLPISPAHALRAWLDALDAAGITEGAIFREVSKGGAIGERLRPNAVAAIVKRAASAAGLDPALYAGHSLRAGFLTEGSLQGVPVTEMMAQSGHKVVETAMGYMRVANPFQANGAMRILQTSVEATPGSAREGSSS